MLQKLLVLKFIKDFISKENGVLVEDTSKGNPYSILSLLWGLKTVGTSVGETSCPVYPSLLTLSIHKGFINKVDGILKRKTSKGQTLFSPFFSLGSKNCMQ